MLKIAGNDLTAASLPYLTPLVLDGNLLELDISSTTKSRVYCRSMRQMERSRPKAPGPDGAAGNAQSKARSATDAIQAFMQACVASRLTSLDVRRTRLHPDIEQRARRACKLREVAAKGVPADVYDAAVEARAKRSQQEPERQRRGRRGGPAAEAAGAGRDEANGTTGENRAGGIAMWMPSSSRSGKRG